MPKCKNDPSRTYKEDEPYPKGLVYDSIKKRYLENIYLYNNFDFKKEEREILREYFPSKMLV